MADSIAAKGLAVGSLVAPVWPGTVGDSAMGSVEQRARFVDAVRKACRIARILNEHGVRRYGVIRIDSGEAGTALQRAGVSAPDLVLIGTLQTGSGPRVAVRAADLKVSLDTAERPQTAPARLQNAFARLAAPYCPHRKHHTPRRRRCFVARRDEAISEKPKPISSARRRG